MYFSPKTIAIVAAIMSVAASAPVPDARAPDYPCSGSCDNGWGKRDAMKAEPSPSKRGESKPVAIWATQEKGEQIAAEGSPAKREADARAPDYPCSGSCDNGWGKRDAAKAEPSPSKRGESKPVAIRASPEKGAQIAAEGSPAKREADARAPDYPCSGSCDNGWGKRDALRAETQPDIKSSPAEGEDMKAEPSPSKREADARAPDYPCSGSCDNGWGKRDAAKAEPSPSKRDALRAETQPDVKSSPAEGEDMKAEPSPSKREADARAPDYPCSGSCDNGWGS